VWQSFQIERTTRHGKVTATKRGRWGDDAQKTGEKKKKVKPPQKGPTRRGEKKKEGNGTIKGPKKHPMGGKLTMGKGEGGTGERSGEAAKFVNLFARMNSEKKKGSGAEV